MVSNDLTIAVVEDDPNLQNMYKFKLEYEGFNVVTADNGQEGLVIAEKHRPHVILLDLRMPVMDGSEMLTRLRQSNWGSAMRVIILTNISKNEAPQSLRFLNVDRYIVKAHCTPAQIVEVIWEVVG